MEMIRHSPINIIQWVQYKRHNNLAMIGGSNSVEKGSKTKQLRKQCSSCKSPDCKWTTPDEIVYGATVGKWND